ncbi:MAG: acyl-CoA dehydrogenase [Candidatus Berkiella sp.]
MGGWSLLIVIMGLIWGAAYYRLPIWAWTALLAGSLVIFQLVGFVAWSALILWPLLLIIALPLNLGALRKPVTAKLFHWFRSVLPSMSITEKEAIEAGDVWWEKELFQGRPDFKQLLAMPKPELSAIEQAFLDNQVETLCDMLNDWKIVHKYSDLPQEAWNYLRQEKFFGMIIPKEYGGLEFSPQAHSAVIMKIGTRSISAAVTTMVPNSLGPAELLLHYGTNEQKDYYLPRLANGIEIPCFALTGPDAGSDAGAIPDTGIVCMGKHEGKEVLGIRLNFDKRYITLAPVATVMGLAFKLYDPDALLGEQTDLGITVCLMPTNHPGIEIGHRHFPLNMAFMNGPIRGHDVFIPIDWIIGGQQMAGKGWRMLMECLSAGRGISLPALSTATGSFATRMTGTYAAIRRQFNVAIGQFEGVEEALARIVGYTYLLESTRLFTLIPIKQNIRAAVATAIAKYHMTEMSRVVINDAMDIHGGRGIMMGPHNYLGRGYQSMPVSITVEGANILTRSLMIFGQGAIRCHPYVYEEIQIAMSYDKDPEGSVNRFDDIVIKHTGYIISNFARSLWLSLTRGLFHRTKLAKECRYFEQKFSWLSAGLALSSDVAMFTLGGDLKRKEKLSARLGDVLSQLQIASATLKYYHDHGCDSQEWPVAKWSLQLCCYKIQEAFYGFFENFSYPIIGKILSIIVFPWGRAFKYPSDKLGGEIAKMILQPTTLREKLTGICYVGKNVNDPTGLMEIGFELLIKNQPILERLHTAVKRKEISKHLSFEEKCQVAFNLKIIDADERNSLIEYESVRKKVIAVDEFPADYALGTGAEERCHTEKVEIMIK